MPPDSAVSGCREGRGPHSTPRTPWGPRGCCQQAVPGASCSRSPPAASVSLPVPRDGGCWDGSPAGAVTAAGSREQYRAHPSRCPAPSRGDPGVRPGLLQSLGRARGERRPPTHLNPRSGPAASCSGSPHRAPRPALRSTRPTARARAHTAASASALRLLERRAAMTQAARGSDVGAAGCPA